LRARAWSRALGALVVTIMLGASRAQALPLQRLHVTSFALSSNAARVPLEQPFYVIVTLHVTENVAELPNITLPDFFGVEELGDERHTNSGAGGTDYREVLTLVAHQSGTIHFTRASLAAIDARDGKPKRFLSNELNVTVTGGVASARATVAGLRGALVSSALVALAFGLAIVALFGLRRPLLQAPPAPPVARPVDVPPAPPESPQERLRRALDALRTARSRPSALLVRRELWATIGAREGETLADALEHPGAALAGMHAALRAAERAAFINDAYLQTAIDELLDTMERTRT
jgi:hypothetical protein